MRRVIAVLGVLIMASVLSLADNVIVNGGFDTRDFTGWDSDFLAGMNITDSLSNSGCCSFGFGNLQYGSIWQPLNLAPGTDFRLSFDLFVGEFSNFFEVHNSLESFMSGELNPTWSWVHYEFLGTIGQPNDFIMFGGWIDPNIGYATLIDNVSVEAIEAVPEPGTLMLMGTGLLGLAGAVRRRCLR